MATIVSSRPRAVSISVRNHLRERWLTYLFLAVMGLMIALPLVALVLESFTRSGEILRFPPTLIPAEFVPDNYNKLFGTGDLQLGRWLFNSFFVSTTATVAVVIVCSMAAYAFARLKFPGRNILFGIFLATIMVPQQITLIPNYLLMRDLKFLNSYNALIWPAVANVFAVFLLRQFFMAIPKELEEAAVLDGASYFGVFWHVIIPLSTTALTAMGIFVFLANWNDLLWPLLVAGRTEMRTLPVGLTVLNGAYAGTDRGLVLAGATFATIPVLIVYIIFQRNIIKGVTMTGLAGQ
jgi:multiple sugar transport system permease protein